MQQVFMCLQCSRVLGRSYSQLRVLARSMSRHTAQEPGSVVTHGMRQHLEQLMERHAAIVTRLSSENSSSIKQNEQSQLYKEVSKLEPIVKLTHLLEEKQQELLEYNEMMREEELAVLAMEDRERCVGDIYQLEVSLINALVPQDEADDAISTILEVRSGAGGREASLFTSEMFTMYNKFADYKGWKFEHLSCDISDDGGYKSASASITGTSVYKLLKLEAGVHRVQRVPSTEGLGRVHTSTMSVAVLPQPSEVDVHINPNDLKVETFRAQGAGGQHVNTTDSAVRMSHTPSGIVVKMQDERSQHQNRVKALKILRARLYEVKRAEKDRERVKERREQIGSGGRQERIRTYNYNQDRVTDHRVGVTLYGVLEFLQGGHQLEHLIEQLKQHQLTEYLTRAFGK